MISIRPIKTEDASLLFDWANEAQVRFNAISRTDISWEGHLAWLKSKLNNGTTYMFILEDENMPIGQIRFDKIGSVYEVDYSIEKHFRGQGFGTVVVNEGIKKLRKHTDSAVIAKVWERNIASIKVFKKLGFIHKGRESCNGRKFEVFEKIS